MNTSSLTPYEILEDVDISDYLIKIQECSDVLSV